ncbi:fasciclin domain-containing protein [Pontibacter litorisediminis]|uniref:fasciclin domain-containing protein n=1 Tax=Pontibacter litorisediminis TaxID=1846260 RepID=UPI0023ECC4F1|nr:fasciclin domain-containing protein [Pontibacter litorisediminis]
MKLTQPYLYIKFLLIALFALGVHTTQAQENRSMMEYLVQERPVLSDLLTKAGFTPLLSGNVQITLFAPSESTLQSISNESPERLRAILSSHIVKGVYLEQDLKEGKSLTPVCNTSSITIYRKRGQTLVNGVSIQRPDVQVKNGVVHELAGMIRS